ncbi:unnamed protein product, partial [Ectocarpus sp. 13 AM-2016]
GTSRYLAKKLGPETSVTGITLSPKQVCACVYFSFISSIDRANRLTNVKTPVSVRLKTQPTSKCHKRGPREGASSEGLCGCGYTTTWARIEMTTTLHAAPHSSRNSCSKPKQVFWHKIVTDDNADAARTINTEEGDMG